MIATESLEGVRRHLAARTRSPSRPETSAQDKLTHLRRVPALETDSRRSSRNGDRQEWVDCGLKGSMLRPECFSLDARVTGRFSVAAL